jgi:hypothetical protein
MKVLHGSGVLPSTSLERVPQVERQPDKRRQWAYLPDVGLEDSKSSRENSEMKARNDITSLARATSAKPTPSPRGLQLLPSSCCPQSVKGLGIGKSWGGGPWG